jgi:release factor glutamine methyltransferase
VFDIIVSNPPYIKQSEEKTCLRMFWILNPPFALFVPDEDALFFTGRSLHLQKRILTKGGSYFFRDQ